MQRLKKNALCLCFTCRKRNSNVADELTSVISDGAANARNVADELTSVISDGAADARNVADELTSVISDGAANARNVADELTSLISDGAANASQIEQLSNLDNGDEDIDFPNSCGIFGVLLTFVDLSLIITDLIVTDNLCMSLGIHELSLVIALFYLTDVLLQVSVKGIQSYFSDILNSVDAVIIVVTLLVNIVYIFYIICVIEILKDITRLSTVFRLLRLIILLRVFHLAYQKRCLEKLCRRMVSENKRRYKKDGFDLDLTYITECIIAMSFPSSGKMSFYRNPIKEVARFLNTKHRNHYQVYNLCSERDYDPKYFHYRVHRIMINDHNVPSLSGMLTFTKEVAEWMAQDNENTVVIHCKGGKGRTGTMVCAILIASEIFKTAEDTLYYFGERRTDRSISAKFQGVETPSQSRYVGYFADVKNIYNWTLPPVKVLTMKEVIIHSIRGVGKGNGNDLKIQITMQQKTVFSCSASKNCTITHDVEADRVIFNLINCPPLYDDVKMQFFCPNLPKYYDNCPFFFWFHTSFIQSNRLYLSRTELDNPHRPKTWNIYRPGFAVEVCFDEVLAGT
ncbi:phosphatidylinositol 3,4,5-trisphosphate 3-phosphatase TPTE2-like isoform X2 [Manis pentadactyla]|uniref:phosphatidylinositol 3,4,5-trisphosphate 3-phosphatase TPTE2-like isoform X2 n=1 Tax=Manis pentadactyla TaxID=143292 RepID=UPI00255C8BFC|nr:phosphatidylinositol 3,4,5-trisphosphate 3-phosphatase TPTE2-like isoform X2 [Manis pentadactyla]